MCRGSVTSWKRLGLSGGSLQNLYSKYWHCWIHTGLTRCSQHTSWALPVYRDTLGSRDILAAGTGLCSTFWPKYNQNNPLTSQTQIKICLTPSMCSFPVLYLSDRSKANLGCLRDRLLITASACSLHNSQAEWKHITVSVSTSNRSVNLHKSFPHN